MTRGDLRRACVSVVSLAAGLGCVTAGPAGGGPSPAPAPTATVATTGDVLVDSIDGANMRGDDVAEARTRFVVTAGRHEIGVSRHTLGRGILGSRVHFEYARVCVEAAAGHVYTVRSVVRPDGTWTTDVYDHTASASVATTCAPVPEPFVAGDGPADAIAPATPAPVAAPAPVITGLTAPINDRRPHRPGTGPVVQVGTAFGGDALPGMPESGDSNGGDGLMWALAGTITPFWNARDLGLGADLELGWKATPFRGRSFSRFPVRATVHVLVRLRGPVYVRLAAGAEKHFGGRISSQTGEPDITMQGGLGPAGDAGLYTIMSRHMALEASLRYARLDYTDGTATIDGSSVGVVLGLHYNVRAF